MIIYRNDQSHSGEKSRLNKRWWMVDDDDSRWQDTVCIKWDWHTDTYTQAIGMIITDDKCNYKQNSKSHRPGMSMWFKDNIQKPEKKEKSTWSWRWWWSTKWNDGMTAIFNQTNIFTPYFTITGTKIITYDHQHQNQYYICTKKF